MKLENQVTKHRKLRGGGYYAVHKWLSKHYGKADRCEHAQCSRKSKTYQWALIHGYQYEHKRENFVMMCVSCHIKYDKTTDGMLRMRLSKIGKHHSEEHKLKISKSMKGKNKGELNGSWKGGQYAT